MRRLAALALLTMSAAPVAPVAQPLYPELAGAALLDALVADYKPTTVLSLDASKDVLYSVVDSAHVGGQTGTVGLYTGLFVPFDCDPNCDPSQDVFNGGSGISQEHIWPRSRGAECDTASAPTCDDRAERDLHHLRPARQAVNAARGNLPFGDSDDGATTAWYRLDVRQSNPPPLAERDEWSERQGAALFEPREAEKGDVARAVLYFYTMYGPRSTGQADEAFFEAMLGDLLAWHAADPVDSRESARMDRAAGYQGGLANPYVVDATLAERAFGGDTTPGPTLAAAVHAPVAWLNEVHYDNDGTDVGEFVEVAVDSSYHALGRLTVTLYNGNGGASYDAHALSAFDVGQTAGAARLYHLAISGIQNGAPDGIALSYSGGGVVADSLLAFLCYEGTFTASGGPADGETCIDMGVSESTSTAAGTSLQLVGTGSYVADFTWTAGSPDSPGAANTGQTIVAPEHVATLAGPEGWHFVAAPTPTALSGLLAGLWTQGAARADVDHGAPNVYRHAAASGWTAVGDLGATLAPGLGRIVYVYADDDPRTEPVDGGFPKTVSASGYAPSLPFAFPLAPRLATTDGFQLLGNPTPDELVWGGWPSTDVGATVHVYDPALPGYLAHNGTAGSLPGGAVAPFAAFWVEATGDSPSLRAPRTAPRPARRRNAALTLRAETDSGGRPLAALWTLALDERAAPGLDALDGRWLDPPDAAHLQLKSRVPDGGSGTDLLLDARPDVGADTVWVEVALPAASGEHDVRVSWAAASGGTLAGLVLFDPTTEATASLDADGAAIVTVSPDVPARLGLIRSAATSADERPGSRLTLGVGPNPARASARVWASSPGAIVEVAVFDVLGRRVARHLARDRLDVALDTGSVAPGVYTIVATTQSGPVRRVRRLTVVR